MRKIEAIKYLMTVRIVKNYYVNSAILVNPAFT